jgi:hypothetical protein
MSNSYNSDPADQQDLGDMKLLVDQFAEAVMDVIERENLPPPRLTAIESLKYTAGAALLDAANRERHILKALRGMDMVLKPIFDTVSAAAEPVRQSVFARLPEDITSEKNLALVDKYKLENIAVFLKKTR